MSGPWLEALELTDPPEVWSALGFALGTDGALHCGGVAIEFGAASAGWRLGPGRDERPAPSAHPNGVTGVDHFVLLAGDFDRSALRLADEGLALTRVREVPVTETESFRQGFRRLGPAILELVETRDSPRAGERFWGITFEVGSFAPLREALGEHLGSERDAVQPGRRIATLRRSAGVACAVAFITPEGG